MSDIRLIPTKCFIRESFSLSLKIDKVTFDHYGFLISLELDLYPTPVSGILLPDFQISYLFNDTRQASVARCAHVRFDQVAHDVYYVGLMIAILVQTSTKSVPISTLFMFIFT